MPAECPLLTLTSIPFRFTIRRQTRLIITEEISASLLRGCGTAMSRAVPLQFPVPTPGLSSLASRSV
jgi:hypothetical protein